MTEMAEIGDKAYTKEQLWEVHLKQLAQRNAGALEMQGVMDQLGIESAEARMRFLAFATEFEALAKASLGATANRPQMALMARKWGVWELVERLALSLKDRDDPNIK